MGVSTPTQALDVAGNSRVSGFSYMGSSTFATKMLKVTGTTAAAGSFVDVLLPLGVTSSKVVAVYGTLQLADGTYPIGQPQDTTLNTRVRLTTTHVRVFTETNATAAASRPFSVVLVVEL